MPLSDQDRAEIAEDLATQGLDFMVTPDDVAATFNLHETTQIPDDNPAPFPAAGPDWRYSPQPDEADLFADTSGMFVPPTADTEVGPTQTGEPLTP